MARFAAPTGLLVSAKGERWVVGKSILLAIRNRKLKFGIIGELVEERMVARHSTTEDRLGT
jgi:hypothetical protein